MKLPVCLLGIVIAAFVAVACSGSTEPSASAFAPVNARDSVTQHSGTHRARRGLTVVPITKIFVIVQENRSVDNLFNGFHGANTQSWGMFGSTYVPLRKDHMAVAFDLYHGLNGFQTDTGCPHEPSQIPWFCPMDDFTYPAGSGSGGGTCGGSGSGSGYCDAYAYVGKEYTKPYWAMAEQYVFGDEMFQSQLDGSYTAHQYLVAANADSRVNFPHPLNETCKGTSTPEVNWITDARNLGSDPTYKNACLKYTTTIATELGNKQLDWRYYNAKPISSSGLPYWDPFFYITAGATYGYGHDVRNPCQFLTDIGKSKYTPSVTWITPSYEDSDHSAGTKDYFGPDWVTAVVNAIGQSNYWNESVIFITWDDWGGWYDHVQPKYADYDGLGMRVPFIIISPYIKPSTGSTNIVTHVQYEQASILKYIEDLFGMSSMSNADSRAADPGDETFWQLKATPRPFTAFSPYPEGYDCSAEGSPDND
jgi:phospholipase C